MTRPRLDSERKKRYLGRRRWTPDEEELLEQLAGTIGLTKIAERLGRSIASVSSHAAALGLSLELDGFSINELCRILGINHYRAIREWVEGGMLEGVRNPGRGRWGEYQVTEEALLAFLKAYPHLVDRSKVDVAYRQFVDERWITLGEAFRRGAAHVLSLEHAYQAGLLPDARRRGLYIVIPEAVLSTLVEARRRIKSDLEHRRMLAVYEATQRRARPRRRAAYHAKQQFDADPIVTRLLEVGRVRDVDLYEEAVGG
jgi:hypothetical protein